LDLAWAAAYSAHALAVRVVDLIWAAGARALALAGLGVEETPGRRTVLGNASAVRSSRG
jgi:hypothetical protein